MVEINLGHKRTQRWARGLAMARGTLHIFDA